MPMQFVTDQFKDLNITTAKIADDGVTADKISLNAGDYAFTANATLSWAGTPSATDDVANKAYVDSVASGLDLKESVMVASVSNLTLSGTQTIDGVAVTAGKRVLVKDQTDLSENGIYVCAAGSWSRATDFAAGDDEAGAFCFVEQGTVNGDNGFVCTNNAGSAVVGTDDLEFTQFSGAGQITAGDGLAKTGNTLSVNVDDSSIEISSDTLQVKASGITNAMLAGSIDEGKLAGSISNGKLANSSISLGGVSIALGATDATPAFDLQDATGYATSALVGTITNDQLAGSIGDNKLLTIATANKVSINAINIDGGDDIDAALADADLIIVDDGGGGTNRKSAMSRIPSYVFGKTSGDVVIASNGAAVIQQGAVDNAMLAGSIANAKLANSSVSFGGISVALGASDATPAFDLTDATNYPTSSLVGTITNAQLAGSIANAKLANSTMTVSDGTNSTAIALGGTMTFTGTEFSESSGTISLAADAVKFSNLKVLPGAQGAGGDNSTVAFNLQNRVASDWFDRVLVFRNGQLQQKVGSNPADSSQYTVTDDGSNTTVTFGVAPLSGESIFISYLYEG